MENEKKSMHTMGWRHGKEGAWQVTQKLSWKPSEKREKLIGGEYLKKRSCGAWDGEESSRENRQPKTMTFLCRTRFDERGSCCERWKNLLKWEVSMASSVLKRWARSCWRKGEAYLCWPWRSELILRKRKTTRVERARRCHIGQMNMSQLDIWPPRGIWGRHVTLVATRSLGNSNSQHPFENFKPFSQSAFPRQERGTRMCFFFPFFFWEQTTHHP